MRRKKKKEGVVNATTAVDSSADDGVMTIQDFTISSNAGRIEQDGVIHILSNGAVELKKPFPLDAGDFTLSIEGKGTAAYGVYPKIKILFNDVQVAETQLLQDYIKSPIPVKVSKKDNYTIKIVFDADGLDDKGNDRDVFIKSVAFEKKTN